MEKKKVQFNDATGVIKLTLWAPTIKSVSKNGVYDISQVKVTEWLKRLCLALFHPVLFTLITGELPYFSTQKQVNFMCVSYLKVKGRKIGNFA